MAATNTQNICSKSVATVNLADLLGVLRGGLVKPDNPVSFVFHRISRPREMPGKPVSGGIGTRKAA